MILSNRRGSFPAQQKGVSSPQQQTRVYGSQTHYSGSSSGRDPGHCYGARPDGWHGIRGVPLSGTFRLIAGRNRQRHRSSIGPCALVSAGCAGSLGPGGLGHLWPGWKRKKPPGHYSVRLDTRLVVFQFHRSGDRRRGAQKFRTA
jgi:hypothetical protein